MSLLDRFAPPPGAPGAVHAGAACWRGTADRLGEVADHLRSRSAVLGGSWEGPGKDAFVAATMPLLDAVDEAAGLLREFAQRLDEHAVAIENAQAEYRQCIAAAGITIGVGVLLTPVTAGVSNGVTASMAGAQLAVVAAITATAGRLLLLALTDLVAQAAALAARWAVLFGVSVAADAASGMVVHGDLNPFAHLHLAQDAQLALVGGLAVPISGRMLAGLGGVADGALLTGATGRVTRLAVGGASTATADTLVRAALGQGVDPGALVLAALPLGPVGRPGGGGPRSAPREVPLGFADADEFAAFGRHLSQGLRSAGYDDVVPVFQGSSVTGVKYTNGKPFDAGRVSDFDIALASPTLFERARAMGVEVRGKGTRTAPLKEYALLQELDLFDLQARLSASVGGRPVAFMIYRDLDSVLTRSPSIKVPSRHLGEEQR